MVIEVHKRRICVDAAWNVVALSDIMRRGNDRLLTKGHAGMNLPSSIEQSLSEPRACSYA